MFDYVCLNFPASVFEDINYFCHDMLLLAPAIVVNKYILFLPPIFNTIVSNILISSQLLQFAGTRFNFWLTFKDYQLFVRLFEF